jgi:ABC-2 type transport system permease protein
MDERLAVASAITRPCTLRGKVVRIADVAVTVSVAMTLAFLAVCMAIVWWFFKTGYRLKN